MLAVTTIADTVAGSYLVAFFPTPVTMPFDGSGTVLFDRTLSISNFALAKGRIVGVEIA